jgi:hypothetical protein
MTDEQPNYDENKTVAAAQALVAKLVKADRARKFQVRLLGVVCAVLLAVVGWLGYLHITHPEQNALVAAQRSEQQYVQVQLQHECQALELLTATPVPAPADPAANPSRETTYKFYEALLFWERADGCTVITVHSSKLAELPWVQRRDH